MSERTIPFTTLPNWLKAAARCGIDSAQVVEWIGQPIEALDPQQARVSPATLDQLMLRCVDASRGPYFPLVLGETFAFEYLSDLETFVTTSGSLREAARVFGWLQQMVHPSLDLQFAEDGPVTRLALADGGRAPLQRYYAESVFASVLKCARSLSTQTEQMVAVEFSHSRPDTPDLEAALGVPVHFDQPRNALRLQTALLDAPLPGHLPGLHDVAERRIAAQLAQHAAPSSVAESVSQLLSRQPQLLRASTGEIASQLQLHPRSLQRRLQQEGHSLQQLLDSARCREAQRQLRESDTALDDLAEALGYSDRRSFTRAFKRWAGCAPSSWRRQQG